MWFFTIIPLCFCCSCIFGSDICFTFSQPSEAYPASLEQAGLLCETTLTVARLLVWFGWDCVFVVAFFYFFPQSSEAGAYYVKQHSPLLGSCLKQMSNSWELPKTDEQAGKRPFEGWTRPDCTEHVRTCYLNIFQWTVFCFWMGDKTKFPKSVLWIHFYGCTHSAHVCVPTRID